MNAIAALCQSFLNGDILTIKTAFKDVGITNLGREVGRSIERKFGVSISKFKKNGKSRFRVPIYWYQYRLNRDDPSNAEGIEAMTKYVKDHGGDAPILKRPVGRPKETPPTKNFNPLF